MRACLFLIGVLAVGSASTAGASALSERVAPLPSLSPRSSWTTQVGGATGEALGGVLADVGDVNGDGVDDLAIGDPTASPKGRRHAGSAYVLLSRSGRAALDATRPTRRLVRLMGASGGRGLFGGDRFGSVIAGVGDVNGDGLDDVAISAPQSDVDGRNSGRVYIVMGRRNGTTIDLRHLGRGVDVIRGDTSEHLTLGGSVGDRNEDGRDDVLVAASRTAGGSKSQPVGYIISGGQLASSPRADHDWLQRYVSIHSMTSVLPIGDVDGDGTIDVGLGSPTSDPAKRGRNSGAAWIVLGRSTLAPRTVRLGRLASGVGSEGYRIVGPPGRDCTYCVGAGLGNSLVSLGDINDDGLGDFLVTADGAYADNREQAGAGYVVLGRKGVRRPIDLTHPSRRWFVLDGPRPFVGAALNFEPLGDVNGDGYDDFAVLDLRPSDLHVLAWIVVYGSRRTGDVDLASYASTAIGGPGRGNVGFVIGLGDGKLAASNPQGTFRGRTHAGRVYVFAASPHG